MSRHVNMSLYPPIRELIWTVDSTFEVSQYYLWVLGHNGVWNTFSCRRLAIPRSTQGLQSVRWKCFCENAQNCLCVSVRKARWLLKNSFSVQEGINTRDFTDRGAIIKYLIMRMCSVAQRRKIDGEPECWLSWMSFTVHYISQEPFISVLYYDFHICANHETPQQ